VSRFQLRSGTRHRQMKPKSDKYSEEVLVKRPAMELLSQLGWSVRNCFHEFDDNDLSFLGRDNKANVVLVSRLKPVFQKFNSDLQESIPIPACADASAGRN